MDTRPFYITTPIYYVNDIPHIGHAYTCVACDVVARAMRLYGRKVMFLTGTDEHGQKVEKSAQLKGIKPQDFVNEVSQHFRDIAKTMHITNDDFIRTTEPRHSKAAQALWKTMLASGDIYSGSYAGWYAVRDEAFYQESELVNGKAPTGAEVEWVEEPSYFFKLSAWGEKLLAFYEAHPDFISPPARRNEVISFVKGGLKDLSISRTAFSWGIPVPGDEKHIMYVWLDALVNYLSAIDYPDIDSEKFQDFWVKGQSMHVMGKDILRFHAVYWPAFLMAAGLPLPYRIFAHGWWTIEGEKMSKSLGNVISPHDLIAQFGLDQTRYFLLREVPFGNDGNFSREALINRINSELANTIGNLAQRTLSLIAKNNEGRVPTPGNFTLEDKELLEKIQVTHESTHAITQQRYVDCKFGDIFGSIVEAAGKANEYIDKQAPWTLKKTDEARMRTVLYVLAESIRCIAIMLQPVIPHSAGKMLAQTGYSEAEIEAGVAFSELAPEYALKAGSVLPTPQPVFPRYAPPEV